VVELAGDVFAKGSFVKRGDHIFRTAAEIYIAGTSAPKRILLCMLNPGESKLESSKDWNSFINGENAEVEGSLHLDRTMERVVHLLRRANPNFSGIVRIENLFNLRCSKAKTAIDQYKSLKGAALHGELLESRFDNMASSDLIWIAWTIETGKDINARKELLHRKFSSEGRPILGKFKQIGNQHYHAWHVRPQRKDQQVEYEEFIVPLLKKYL